MSTSQTITLFYILVGASAAFVIAIGVAVWRKWMSLREFLYVAPVLVVGTAISLGSFLYKVYPHSLKYLGEAGLTDAMYTIAIGVALVSIYKRAKRSEAFEQANPVIALKKAPIGPPVSASELRKRKKKRL